MARKLTQESLEKKIEAKKHSINQLQIQLKMQKTELEDMEAQLAEMKRAQVADIIARSGKSIEEIMQLLGVE